MKAIITSAVSNHVEVDRQARFDLINKTIGFGSPVVEAPDKKGRDCTATLTDTGVIVIIDPYGIIVTAWIASVRQAQAVWNRATGNFDLPEKLWNQVNYNNNTAYWQKKVAA